ncbi:MerR family transcriptional regulator [Metabacillus iocasae]|uniref:DNA-binding transcriptional MerR regulator n=1 Tax=Priestia iocasae TaxID=2291674 RepID=A0ABS2QUX8_9BACI|nr:MerR family DNA-binding transcriptional regulator [Metabacillus iocasae]MBM7703296.1 DNA-binding transcriptional MerR regulator [Metabacillus iocasae]
MNYTISQITKEFNISARTIRYYEERGLMTPIRTTKGQRLYTKQNRTVLKLILRGKRFGFSLEEIQEMIELFDVDQTGIAQLETTVAYGKKKVEEMNQQIQEMMELRDEMNEFLRKFEQILQKGEKGNE